MADLPHTKIREDKYGIVTLRYNNIHNSYSKLCNTLLKDMPINITV